MPKKQDMKRILRWVKQWQQTLNLQNWTITVHYSDKDEESRAEPGFLSAAETDRQFNYLSAAITIFPGFWEEALDVQWSQIAHEMIHVVLSDYDQLLYMAQEGKGVFNYEMDRVRERTTVKLTNLVTSMWPYNKNKC